MSCSQFYQTIFANQTLFQNVQPQVQDNLGYSADGEFWELIGYELD